MADESAGSRQAKLRAARRRLVFDDGDATAESAPSRAELEGAFAQERAQHLKEKEAKWNFDFATERPLEGQWQWERVDKPNGDAPESADASAQGIRGDAEKQAP